MTNEARLARAKEEIRARLRKVCSGMSDEEFEELVHKVAIAELKPRAFGSTGTERQSPLY